MNKAGIVGFRGYSGAELVHLLSHHPHLEPVLLEHREAEAQALPIGRPGPLRVRFSAEAIREHKMAVVFLATPPEASMELSGPILNAGAKVVDLSGAFRLGTVENYKRWYKEDFIRNCWRRRFLCASRILRAKIKRA